MVPNDDCQRCTSTGARAVRDKCVLSVSGHRAASSKWCASQMRQQLVRVVPQLYRQLVRREPVGRESTCGLRGRCPRAAHEPVQLSTGISAQCPPRPSRRSPHCKQMFVYARVTSYLMRCDELLRAGTYYDDWWVGWTSISMIRNSTVMGYATKLTYVIMMVGTNF